MTVLQPGTVAARIVHRVMSGKPLTVVEECEDPLAEAVAAAHYLAHRRDQLLVELCADTIADRDRLLGRAGRAMRALPRPGGVRDWRHRVSVTCPQDPDQWTDPDVGLVLAGWVDDPETVATVMANGLQLVALGPVPQPVLDACRRHAAPYRRQHIGHLRTLWGELPLEVILAAGTS